jgi:glycosyltransferase involved in cell wall biosynthesis
MSTASIIVPLFNAENTIGLTLESALSQTWKDTEVIVVDDGSTDSSLRVVRQYECGQLLVIAQSNAGPGVARNSGFAASKGDYIQFLDDDDMISRDKIESQIRLLESEPRGHDLVSLTGTKYFQDGTDPEAGILHNGWPMVDTDDPLEWLIQLHGGGSRDSGGMVHPASWLVPRTICVRAGGWDEQPSPDDDGEYFARVVLRSSGIRRSARGLSYYRKYPKRGQSLSTATSEVYLRAQLRSLKLRADDILSRTSDAHAKRALASCYKDRAFNAYPYAPSVTNEALSLARALGDCRPPNQFGTPLGRAAAKVFGWRAVKRANVLYHRMGHRTRD